MKFYKSEVKVRNFFIAIILAISAACESEIRTSAVLNSTQDIKKGAPIFMSGEVVGEVVSIKQQSNTTELTIELNNKGKSTIKNNAAIVVNRLKSNSPLEVYNKQNETELIQDESQLVGLNSMLELGAWMVGDSISSGGESLIGYVDAFQRYLNGEKFQQDKQVLQSAAEQIGKDVQGMAKVLGDEVQKATQELSITEQKAAQAIEQFGNELAPVIGEFSKSSQAIVEELEKFTENIELQDQQGQEIGTTILSSLLKALETVNENIESSDNSEPDDSFRTINPEIGNTEQEK